MLYFANFGSMESRFTSFDVWTRLPWFEVVHGSFTFIVIMYKERLKVKELSSYQPIWKEVADEIIKNLKYKTLNNDVS